MITYFVNNFVIGDDAISNGMIETISLSVIKNVQNPIPWTKILTCLLEIGFGIPLCFFGLKYHKFFMTAVGFLLGYISMDLTMTYIKSQNKDYEFSLLLSIFLFFSFSSLTTITVYFIIYRWTTHKWRIRILGQLCGTVIGLALSQVLYILFGYQISIWLYIIIIALFTGFGFVVSLYMNTYFLILISSSNGAQLTSSACVQCLELWLSLTYYRLQLILLFVFFGILMFLGGFICQYLQFKNEMKQMKNLMADYQGDSKGNGTNSEQNQVQNDESLSLFVDQNLTSALIIPVRLDEEENSCNSAIKDRKTT